MRRSQQWTAIMRGQLNGPRGDAGNNPQRFQPGDFFAEPLPVADVLVMGHILHDWSLEQKRTLVAHAHAALPTGGALIFFDTVIDDDRRRNAFGLLMSLNMLIETPAGFDYTRPPTARPACERPASATPTSNISRGRTR
jgi:hypothetical protein